MFFRRKKKRIPTPDSSFILSHLIQSKHHVNCFKAESIAFSAISFSCIKSSYLSVWQMATSFPPPPGWRLLNRVKGISVTSGVSDTSFSRRTSQQEVGVPIYHLQLLKLATSTHIPETIFLKTLIPCPSGTFNSPRPPLRLLLFCSLFLVFCFKCVPMTNYAFIFK